MWAINIPQHKQIFNLHADILPNILIVTGENGVGKTSLIEALQQPRNKARQEMYKLDKFWEQPRGGDSALNAVQHFEKRARSFFDLCQNTIKEISKIDLQDLEIRLKEYATDNVSRKSFRLQDFNTQVYGFFNGFSREIDLEDTMFTIRRYIQYFNNIAHVLNKPLDDLSHEDIRNTPVDAFKYIDISRSELLLPSIQKNFLQKEKNSYIHSVKKIRQGDLSHIDKIKNINFVSPVEKINNLLLSFDFKYQLTTGKEMVDEYHDIKHYEPRFVLPSGQKIEYRHLSDGEKMIVSIIIQMFFMKHYSYTTLSDYILLDEPDRSLHPTFIREFIDFVIAMSNKHNDVKIVITTHNPTTVALCPDESIYLLTHQDGKSSLTHTGKRRALAFLTRDLPHLSIQYEKHNQVLVEGNPDAHYYRNIFERMQNEIPHLSKELYFFSGNRGDLNCDKIKRYVENMRQGGIDSIYGIIDYDNKYQSSESVLVHGNRYSIENYLFDPMYVAIAILNKVKSNKSHPLYEQNIFNRLTSIYDIDPSNVSKIHNWFFQTIDSNSFNSDLSSNKTICVNYQSGLSVEYPLSFIEMRGHDLDDLVREKFPALRAYGDTLNQELSIIAARCWPLVDTKTVQLLSELSNKN